MTARREEPASRAVHAIPVLDRWLLFSPENRMAAVVNRAAVAALARPGPCGGPQAAGELQQLWLTLSANSADAPAGGDEPGKVIIIPTRACNMRCVYCDFGAAESSRKTLDPRLACRLIDYAAARVQAVGHTTLRVHLFGGEPLVARACTECVVHYVRSLCARQGLAPWCELTTNGFFEAARIPFVGDYINSVVVSLDGTAPWHDYNRRRLDGGGTYAVIADNLRRLAQYPVELSLRMCVTNRSADAMADLADHLQREFAFDVLSFEMLAENACSRESGLRPPDPYVFAAGVLNAEQSLARHGVRVVHGPSELAEPRTSSCPLGQGSLMITPEGDLTACYLEARRWLAHGLDLTIGRVDAAAGVLVDERKQAGISALVLSKPRCSRCFCRFSCAGGCHVEQTPPGCARDYDQRCRAIRVITAGRLLRRLGEQGLADRLGKSRPAMEALANHPDDRLAYWAEGT